MYINPLERIYSIGFLERRILIVFIDFILLVFSVIFSLSFYISDSKSFTYLLIEYKAIIYTLPVIGIFVYLFSGQYKSISRYLNRRTPYTYVKRNIFIILITCTLNYIFRFPNPSINVWLLMVILISILTFSCRFLISDLLINSEKNKKVTNVAIYGAGRAGVKLSNYLSEDPNYKICFFLDDADHLWKRQINGKNILPPSKIDNFKVDIDQILIAIPSLSKSVLREKIDFLKNKGLRVLSVPSIKDLTTGKYSISRLKNIAIEDVLGRDLIPISKEIIGTDIRDSVVLITGAGGSIGSELCRQVLRLSPKKLLLLERNESSLYEIDQELKNKFNTSVEISSILGCATDKSLLDKLFLLNKIKIVFHAAAYKHVPLVEINPLQGIFNNVFSTKLLCEACLNFRVRKFIFVSTDKAVRPTNVMGASKRLSELIVQGYANKLKNLGSDEKKYTKFSMVRFGNVLGSSGSVMPLFKKQISEGGPITLTHPDIIRYFMSISEAVELVLQASTLTKDGGEIFLLDMGDPIKIKDLAKLMIELAGLKIKDNNNPNGDIEIVCTGLRKGEKLYEELLINGDSISTENPLIFIANDYYLENEFLFSKLDILEDSIKKQDLENSLIVLSDLVKEWKNVNIIDN